MSDQLELPFEEEKHSTEKVEVIGPSPVGWWLDTSYFNFVPVEINCSCGYRGPVSGHSCVKYLEERIRYLEKRLKKLEEILIEYFTKGE
jgi:hypothetical protein